ncbi:MAG TPA: glycyl-radical enzyme activating protein [Clostridiales bacterium]|jgi:pyruvate formate lyase activating enzyme|nr:glycyl-radical enzyme activating protein [Clostridiales bacterium]
MEDLTNVKGKIFNIQGYSIHDGPGIRTTVFFLGCPLRCLWCQNPESVTLEPKLFFIAEKCIGCGRCVAACPKGAITIVDGKAVTDRSKCTVCGECVKVCPTDAREIVGETKTAGEVVKRVRQDELFYKTSGGGVTLSGGEVLMQPEFAYAILKLCKDAGLHTAIETCGFAKWEVFSKILEYTDLVLYDFKHMDSAKHKEGTGVGNELILENAIKVYHEAKKPMAARVPTITGYNDSKENMDALARFIVENLGKDVKVHLLPYHHLGESKTERMEQEVTFTTDVPTDEHMEELRALIASYGLNAVIGG